MTTSPLTLAIAAWLLPAAAFLVLGVLYPLRRSGRPAALVSIVAILGSLVAAIAAWRIAEAGAVQVALWEWLPAHDGPLASVGALADEQSLVMLVLVALVACLVQVYSLGMPLKSTLGVLAWLLGLTGFTLALRGELGRVIATLGRLW